MTQVRVNGELMEIDQRVIALVSQPGLKIDCPERFQITPQTTLKCAQEMPADKWAHISTGEPFRHWFGIVLDKALIPTTVEELREASLDVQHVTGLIVLNFEAVMERREKVFFQLPETYLHPQSVAYLMTLLQSMANFMLDELRNDRRPR